jgi:predicted Zn-dependent peptidase
MKALLCFALWVCALIGPAFADDLQVKSSSLKNGIRFTYLYVPNSKSFSIITFVPIGLAADDAHHAQWSHLCEHLTIRSTIPGDLQNANAETMNDCMHLDYYTTADKWREALSHHQRWLQCLPVDEPTMKLEAQRANSEADTTAQNLASFKFAVAAWDQAFRHGLDHAAIKQDLLDAKLAEIQRYREQHLFVPGHTVVCAVGGVDPKELTAAVAESMGKLTSAAKPRPASKEPKPKDATVSWDINARQLMYSWPIPGVPKPDEYAALLTAARLLMVKGSQDAELQKLTGPFVMAGADLNSPEGEHFCLSVTLRPGADARAARKKLDGYIQSLAAAPELRQMAPLVSKQLAMELKPDMFQALRAQVADPAQMGQMEAQLAIWWGMAEFHYGDQRQQMIRSLESVTPESVDAAVKKYLIGDTRTVLLITPKAQGN